MSPFWRGVLDACISWQMQIGVGAACAAYSLVFVATAQVERGPFVLATLLAICAGFVLAAGFITFTEERRRQRTYDRAVEEEWRA